MSAVPPDSRVDAPAALAAFLRGVERRGAVLAELQCGDAAAGDAALATAMVGFRAAAAELPMADWPRAFWARLLAQPQMRHRTPLAMPLDATDNLADLGSGPRVALLLRLAAGLSEAEAAAVLGVAQPTYQLALRRALPSHADGRADPEAWQRLREQVHRRIRTLSQERLLRLIRAREAALMGQVVAMPAQGKEPDGGKRPRWLLALLWTLLALCAAAFAATFWSRGPALDRWFGGSDDMRVRRHTLPPAAAPASRYGRDAGLIAHRDFALLTDPMAEANTRDLDFYSWLAAQQSTAADGAVLTPAIAKSTPRPHNDVLLETSGGAETYDAPL
ncbi:MAG: hypothetical protein ACREPE_06745 [Lysobacter sp.]